MAHDVMSRDNVKHYELSSLSIPEPNSEGSFRFSCFISTIGSAAERVGPDIIGPGGGCIGTEIDIVLHTQRSYSD